MEFMTSFFTFNLLVSIGNFYANTYFFYSARAVAETNIQTPIVSAYPVFEVAEFNQNGFASYNFSFIVGAVNSSNNNQYHSLSFIGTLFNLEYWTHDGLIGFTNHTFFNFYSIASVSPEFAFNSSGFQSYIPGFIAGLIAETNFIFIQSILGLTFDSLSLIQFYSVSQSTNIESVEFEPLSILEILFGKGAYQNQFEIMIKKNQIGVVNAEIPINILAGILFNALYTSNGLNQVSVELWESIKVIEENGVYYWYAAIVLKEEL